MTHPPEDYHTSPFETDTSSSVFVAEKPDPLKDARSRPVVVTGGAGFVGTPVCAMLVNRGWNVRAIVRDQAKAARRLGHLKLEIRVADIRDATAMRTALTGAGSVIHLAAIAIEKSGDSYESINTDATRILLDSAAAAGVDRFIHMSQNGSDSKSPFPFLRSKGMAQDAVMRSRMRWTILRPSVIFGREDEFVNVLARLVKLSPLVFPLPGGGSARFQPVAVADVARAVINALEDDATVGRSLSLGGPAPITLREMTERILIAMNCSRTLVGIPIGCVRPLVSAGQHLLPHPPVTTGLLDLLAIDNVVESNDLATVLKIEPTPFAPEELLYLRDITVSSAFKSLF